MLATYQKLLPFLGLRRCLLMNVALSGFGILLSAFFCELFSHVVEAPLMNVQSVSNNPGRVMQSFLLSFVTFSEEVILSGSICVSR